jgi:hypothetical protein
MRRTIACAALIALTSLAGCGEDAPVVDSRPYRIVEIVDKQGSCEANESLLSAYCFADKGRSISASGPALQADDEGRLVAQCLTGGRNLRLVCATQP